MGSWTGDEFADIDFNDERLSQRFSSLVDKLSDRAGQSIQLACEDWSNTKAAYRFFSNPKVTANTICGIHAGSTGQRINSIIKEPSSFVLAVQDTTYLNYSYQPKTLGLGEISNFKGHSGKQVKTVGFILHSSLALTEAGVPLGLIDQKLWTRAPSKIGNIIKSGKNMTRIPIEEKESFRWIEAIRNVSKQVSDPSKIIHIGDRESDIFELFHEARAQGSNFLVRIRDHQRILEGGNRIFDPMKRTKVKGSFEIPVKNKNGKIRVATVQVKFYPVRVRPSVAKKQFEPISAYVISAIEIGGPKNEERIDWRLLTNLTITSFKSALEKIKFYEMRWQIEIYHKVIKSGCRVEDIRLRTADRISRYLAVMTIIAWRIYWMGQVSRNAPELAPSAVITKKEKKALRLYCKKKQFPSPQNANDHVRVMARLGGFLARTGDGDPGPLVLWRGYLRLQDILLGISFAPP
jgi:hypothetical protein